MTQPEAVHVEFLRATGGAIAGVDEDQLLPGRGHGRERGFTRRGVELSGSRGFALRERRAIRCIAGLLRGRFPSEKSIDINISVKNYFVIDTSRPFRYIKPIL